jgi:transposase-like protein
MTPMIEPTPLPNETAKAFAAFKIYCEVGASVTKVARRLSVSRQNIEKWRSKYGWKARFNVLRLRSCEQRIAAEEQAVEAVAVVTEASRANAANRVFAVGDRLIALANYFAERASDTSLPLSERQLASNNAARFFNASADVMMAMSGAGGAATGYQVPSVAIQVVSQYEHGEPPPPIKTLEDAERVIADYESRPQEQLPCDDWSTDSVDAIPTIPETPSTPPGYVEREQNPDLVIDKAAQIPGRGGEETPTSDWSTHGPGWVKTSGL